jgi:hypothetical protein
MDINSVSRRRASQILPQPEQLRAAAVFSVPQPTLVATEANYATDDRLVSRVKTQLETHSLPAANDEGVVIGLRGCLAAVTSHRLLLLERPWLRRRLRAQDVIIAAALDACSVTWWIEDQASPTAGIAHISFGDGRFITLVTSPPTRWGRNDLQEFVSALGPRATQLPARHM